MSTEDELDTLLGNDARISVVRQKLIDYLNNFGSQCLELVKMVTASSTSLNDKKKDIEIVMSTLVVQFDKFKRNAGKGTKNLLSECPDIGILVSGDKLGFVSSSKDSELAELKLQLEKVTTELRQKSAASVLTAASTALFNGANYTHKRPAPTLDDSGHQSSDGDESSDNFSVSSLSHNWSTTKPKSSKGNKRRRVSSGQSLKGEMHEYAATASTKSPGKKGSFKSSGRGMHDVIENDADDNDAYDVGTVYEDDSTGFEQAISRPNANKTITVSFRKVEKIRNFTDKQKDEFVCKLTAFFGKRIGNGLAAVGLEPGIAVGYKDSFAKAFFCDFLTAVEKKNIYDTMSWYLDSMPHIPTTDMRENATEAFYRIMEYSFNLPYSKQTSRNDHPFASLYATWNDNNYTIPVGTDIPPIFFFAEYPEHLISSFFWSLAMCNNTALGPDADKDVSGYIECEAGVKYTAIKGAAKGHAMSPCTTKDIIKVYSDIYYVFPDPKDSSEPVYVKRFSVQSNRTPKEFLPHLKDTKKTFSISLNNTHRQCFLKMFQIMLDFIQKNGYNKFLERYPEVRTADSVSRYNKLYSANLAAILESSDSKKSANKVEEKSQKSAKTDAGSGDDNSGDEDSEDSDEDNADKTSPPAGTDTPARQEPAPQKRATISGKTPARAPAPIAKTEDDAGDDAGDGKTPDSGSESEEESASDTGDEQDAPPAKLTKSTPATTKSTPTTTKTTKTTPATSKPAATAVSSKPKAKTTSKTTTTPHNSSTKKGSNGKVKKTADSDGDDADDSDRDAPASSSVVLPTPTSASKNRKMAGITFSEDFEQVRYDTSKPPKQISDGLRAVDPTMTTDLSSETSLPKNVKKTNLKTSSALKPTPIPDNYMPDDASSVPGIFLAGQVKERKRPMYDGYRNLQAPSQMNFEVEVAKNSVSDTTTTVGNESDESSGEDSGDEGEETTTNTITTNTTTATAAGGADEDAEEGADEDQTEFEGKIPAVQSEEDLEMHFSPTHDPATDELNPNNQSILDSEPSDMQSEFDGM